MRATEILNHEHRVIEQVLNCLDQWVEQSEKSAAPDWATAEEILQFLRTFADRCHHGKEEDQLFPMLEERGFSPNAGPTAMMRFEHEQGRRYMAEMAAAVKQGLAHNNSAIIRFSTNARAYTAMLRLHIQKEDHCLFPMADSSFSEADHAELLRRFEETEHGPDLAGEHEKYLRLADDLAERLQVPKAQTGALTCGHCCGHA
jgi:hemerythrin-like domain-containing protein